MKSMHEEHALLLYGKNNGSICHISFTITYTLYIFMMIANLAAYRMIQNIMSTFYVMSTCIHSTYS